MCLIYYQWSLYKWKCAKLLFISLDQTPVLLFKWPLLISIIQNPTNPIQRYCFSITRDITHLLFLVYDTHGLRTAQHVYQEVVTLAAHHFHSICVSECVGYQRKRSNISWTKHFLGFFFTGVILCNLHKIFYWVVLYPSLNTWKNWGLHHLLATVIVLCLVKLVLYLDLF